MKKIVVVLVSLVIGVLIGVGNAFAQDNTFETPPLIPPPYPYEPPIPNPPLGPEWKLVFRGSHGTTYYVNTKRITYLPEGIVKVRILYVPRGEFRREQVNALKQDLLSEGEDPNYAEGLWYVKFLNKINCITHQYAPLEGIFYSFGQAVLNIEFSHYEEWRYIVPGTPGDIVENYVCK